MVDIPRKPKHEDTITEAIAELRLETLQKRVDDQTQNGGEWLANQTTSEIAILLASLKDIVAGELSPVAMVTLGEPGNRGAVASLATLGLFTLLLDAKRKEPKP